jgi:hypothetical protein
LNESRLCDLETRLDTFGIDCVFPKYEHLKDSIVTKITTMILYAYGELKGDEIFTQMITKKIEDLFSMWFSAFKNK